MQKILITGVSGLLGCNLAHYFRNRYELTGLYNSHTVTIRGMTTSKCDLVDSGDLKEILDSFSPDVIIHCASITEIDKCETEREKTKKINVTATGDIVKALGGDRSVKLIYISSDSVYDGAKGDYSETDEINPQNYYGVTKYEGEIEVRRHPNHLILRTNIFGWNFQDKKSLGEWILNELKAGNRISCFRDAGFSTIYTLELARVIDIAIKKNLTGTFNCGASDSASKFEFALKMSDLFSFDKSLLNPISIDDFNFKAKRGKNLTLNVKNLERALGYRLPTIDQSVDAFYRDYCCGIPEAIKHGSSSECGRPDFIPYGRQSIDENDIQKVVEVLRSDRITQGPAVDNFEKVLTEYCGADYAVAVNSGTSALHIGCLAAGIGNGDEVITSPITFVASANCAVYCGASPVFADIDGRTYNISPVEIEKKITEKTKAVIPVHFAGQSCDMERIGAVVRDAEKKYGHKIYIIEDASHALGSVYRGNKVGSCVYSDMTVMSFHPVKHITTGEGGAVLTNDGALNKRLRRFRSHGITNNPEEFVYKDRAFQPSAFSLQPSPNPWYYEQINLGYNYRITDIQCALGISQMKRLDEFRRRRREIVNKYNEAFSNIEAIQIPFEASNCDTNFHLYVLLFDFGRIGIDRAGFMRKLKESGIQTQVHYIPVHLQPFYREHFNTAKSDCPDAEKYYEKCLSIPLYSAMGDDDADKVIYEIKKIIKVA
jgi:UDP-4-amino-4,6-dideoxy-N-acetyl-beta-L-altrosamine transaminase/dTDP-4-dehydrorhamnose reductase